MTPGTGDAVDGSNDYIVNQNQNPAVSDQDAYKGAFQLIKEKRKKKKKNRKQTKKK